MLILEFGKQTALLYKVGTTAPSMKYKPKNLNCFWIFYIVNNFGFMLIDDYSTESDKYLLPLFLLEN